MSKKIQQIKVVAAILDELVKQVPELKISQEQLAVVTTAATNICSVFEERNLCDSCNDWPRGGCLSICSVYGKESDHE
ncbi:hypothetical protein MXZ96_02370 [Providencia stuartii]|uniref:hypothetical protein n=1 Tax=Providencia stuartii TaxID=588 RepID=UPI00111D64C2|nr:hypothetical protein [Providencia stuartii]MCK1142196.1 hypothetical protein [Providencia stuartii]